MLHVAMCNMVNVHTTTLTKADRAALENLWDEAGAWAADAWTALNDRHFGGRLRYHGIVFGLTPHGAGVAHTSHTGRITLHPALLSPRGEDPWRIGKRLGARYAEHVLLHEMIHVQLFDRGVDVDDRGGHHNTAEWCAEITRITEELGLEPIQAAPVLPRRVGGKVVREPLEGHLGRAAIASWPQSIAPWETYTREGRVPVPM